MTSVQPPPDAPRPSVQWAGLGWTRASYVLFSGFCLTLLVIGYVWWPLAADYLATYDPAYPWWAQTDWLLVGIFLAMSALIMAGADLRRDARIVAVGLAGGLVIEGWGTQTHLWTYYTQERPPLWIIPAWPIASLAIDRLYRALRGWTGDRGPATVPGLRSPVVYWAVFGVFAGLMLVFVWPTRGQSLTLAALVLCALLTLRHAQTPETREAAVLIYVAGSALGYFLELWGTTRACWTYYTQETPPAFAVLAHGMAAVAFWRTDALLGMVWQKLITTERTENTENG